MRPNGQTKNNCERLVLWRQKKAAFNNERMAKKSKMLPPVGIKGFKLL